MDGAIERGANWGLQLGVRRVLRSSQGIRQTDPFSISSDPKRGMCVCIRIRSREGYFLGVRRNIHVFERGRERTRTGASGREGGSEGGTDSQRSLVRPSIRLSVCLGQAAAAVVDGAKRRVRGRGPTAMFRDDDRTTDRLDATSGRVSGPTQTT